MTKEDIVEEIIEKLRPAFVKMGITSRISLLQSEIRGHQALLSKGVLLHNELIVINDLIETCVKEISRLEKELKKVGAL